MNGEFWRSILKLIKMLLKRSNENNVPRHIQDYIEDPDKTVASTKAYLTKLNEWIVITRTIENAGFVNVWVSTFMNRKLHKKFAMHLLLKGNTIKILDIKVLGDDRNRGYGTAFMEELFEIIDEKGITKITGLAERPNDPILIDYYNKFGITIKGSQLFWERK